MGFFDGRPAKNAQEKGGARLVQGYMSARQLLFFVAMTGSFLIIVGVILSLKPSVGSSGSSANDTQVLSRTGLRTRSCYNTETKCTPTKDCRGATGNVTSATAIAPDGDICCTFKCEEDYLPIRPCLASEKVCTRGQSCRMGDNVTMPEAFTETGMSCCKFECNTGTIPVRACNMGSEVVCPAGSYCFDFSGNVSVPTARMSNGNSCCRANGTESVCVPSST